MDDQSNMLIRANDSEYLCDQLSVKEYEQLRVEFLNAVEGTRHLEDGYHCPICRNRGYIAKLKDLPGANYTHVSAECACIKIRQSIQRLQQSGLSHVMNDDCTLENFQAVESWQQLLKTAAESYAANPSSWFFVGGQSGSGKTYLCTAICRELLMNGHQVMCMFWQDISKFRRDSLTSKRQGNEIDRYKHAEILYIDGLFRARKMQDGTYKKPSSAEIDLAFEIIDFRYANSFPTIISCEWMPGEILNIDEAVGGRIIERAEDKCFAIAKDPRRNWRIKNLTS